MDTNIVTYRFEDENYSDKMLIFVENFRQKHHGDSSKIQSIRRISKINILDLSSSMGTFPHVVNVTNNGQGRLYMDVCTDTSISPLMKIYFLILP